MGALKGDPGERLLLSFSALLSLGTETTEGETRRHPDVFDRVIPLLLPSGIPVPTAHVVGAPFEECNPARFRMLDIVGRSMHCTNAILKRTTECFNDWLHASWSDASRQSFLIATSGFVRRSLATSAATEGSRSEVDGLARAMARSLQTHAVTECDIGDDARLLREMVWTFQALMETVDRSLQRVTFEDFSGSRPEDPFWQYVIYCAVDEAQDLSLDAVLQFPKAFLQSMPLKHDESNGFRTIVYDVAATVLLHSVRRSIRRQGTDFSETSLDRIALKLSSAEEDPYAFVLFASRCLAAVLYNAESYRLCLTAAASLLPSICRYLKGIGGDTTDRRIEDATRDAVGFLVSDATQHGQHPKFQDPRDDRRSIRRQRALTVCLDVILPRSDHTSHLMALGCLIQKAGFIFVRAEAKRLLPPMLLLIDRQLPTAVHDTDLDFLTDIAKTLSLLVRDVNSRRWIETFKHDILKTFLGTVAFDRRQDIRYQSIASLTFITVSIMTKDERTVYRSKMEKVIRLGLDDRKRRNRQLTACCRLKLDRMSERHE